MGKFVATKTERQAAGRNGARSRYGETIVYIDGQPVSLQRVAAETGLRVDILSQRAKAARDRGEAVALAYITRPLQKKAPRKSTQWSGYVVRKALR